MKIIAHRGFWTDESEKNSMRAFRKAIDEKYGIETDVREYNGSLVLSHDIANSSSVLCTELFEYYKNKKSNSVLALNVKEDGIQSSLKDILKEYEITEYFMFDMSIPEMVVYDRMGFRFFSRHSDIEILPVMYDKAEGIWVDAFFNDWDMVESVQNHLKAGKLVSLISPEIHGKDKTLIWKEIVDCNINDNDNFFLCTDYPGEARDIFGG